MTLVVSSLDYVFEWVFAVPRLLVWETGVFGEFLVENRVLQLVGNLVAKVEKAVVAHCGRLAIEHVGGGYAEFCCPFGYSDISYSLFFNSFLQCKGKMSRYFFQGDWEIWRILLRSENSGEYL